VPRVVDGDARRRDIAAAVTRVLGRDGVEAVTMRNVAAELGSTTGLLTHWVPSRDALIHLALTETANEQTARAIGVLTRRPTDLVGAMEQFMPVDARRRAEMKVWLGFWAFAISNETLRAEQRDRYRDFRTQLGQHLRGLGVPSARAAAAVELLMAAVDGVAVAAVFDPEHWTPARQRRHLRAVVTQTVGVAW
jgi:AcrR family transcriptional regulator